MSEPQPTNEQSQSGQEEATNSVPPLVAAYERLMQSFRDSGLEVTEQVEADGSDYQVTFPQGAVSVEPPAMTEQPVRRPKRVKVTVFWGNDDVEVSIKIPGKTWQQIKDGMPWWAASRYYYEGKRYTAHWSFNGSKKGALRISYGCDGADGYIGSIAGAYVEEL